MRIQISIIVRRLILVVLGMVLGVSLIFMFRGVPRERNYIFLDNVSVESEEKVKSGLKESMDLLEEEIKEIYKYNSTDDNTNLSEEELKERGGDCKDWAEYWIKKLNEKGFYAEYNKVFLYKEETKGSKTLREVFNYGEDKAKYINHYHAYISIGSKNEWCIASNDHYKCWRFE